MQWIKFKHKSSIHCHWFSRNFCCLKPIQLGSRLPYIPRTTRGPLFHCSNEFNQTAPHAKKRNGETSHNSYIRFFHHCVFGCLEVDFYLKHNSLPNQSSPKKNLGFPWPAIPCSTKCSCSCILSWHTLPYHDPKWALTKTVTWHSMKYWLFNDGILISWFIFMIPT